MTAADTRVTLLAQRMRVEERQLIAAFAERDHEAVLIDPATMGISLNSATATSGLVIDRGVATPERATLGALMAASGATVVNRTATTRLLADRLALFRHLVIAGIPVPETIVCFGESAIEAALGTVGYPAYVMTAGVDPAVPDAVIHDRDSGEAIVEHRVTLGPSGITLVQSYVEGETARIIIVGDEVLAAERVNYADDGSMSYLPIGSLSAELRSLGNGVVSRLGSGVYAVKVVESPEGPIVVGAGNLVDFRTVTESGIDIAGQFARFALEQQGK
jgi:[lysine-biosynthesis-protein LysW]--L-2-aminoadipate ligase